MTTETLETTAEVAEDTTATQLDTQSDSVQETTAEAPLTEEVDSDAIIQSFLGERGLSPETEDLTVETKQETAPNLDVQLEAQRIAQATLEAEHRAQQEAGVREAFGRRATGIRNYLLSKGLNPQDTELVVNEFNSHHAQSAPIHRTEAQAEATQNFTNFLYGALEKEMPAVAKRRGEINSTPDLIKAIAEEARKGYVPEKTHKAEVSKAVLDFKKYLEDKKMLPTKAIPSESGSVTPPAKRDVDWALTAPISELMAAKDI